MKLKLYTIEHNGVTCHMSFAYSGTDAIRECKEWAKRNIKGKYAIVNEKTLKYVYKGEI